MKVVLTGGVTGGHFYPLIAVAEDLERKMSDQHLLSPKIYFAAPGPYDEHVLFENKITFQKIHSGKVRRYFSLSTPFELCMVLVGYMEALWFLFRVYPDVIFSKGGYGSVPVVLAGATLGIPIVIHDSDARPGRATKLAAPFASFIALTFKECASFFKEKDQKKIALTGTPVRSVLREISPYGIEQTVKDYDASVPLVLVLGGSLGAQRLNDAILGALSFLLPHVQVVHQTGKAHLSSIEGLVRVVVKDEALMSRYHPMSYLEPVALSRIASASSLIISRAGATTISEIAMWRKPAILVPIPESISHDQRSNAYAYAQTGGATVIEEGNLSPGILQAEVLRILGDQSVRKTMEEGGATFARSDAGMVIADLLLKITESHTPLKDL